MISFSKMAKRDEKWKWEMQIREGTVGDGTLPWTGKPAHKYGTFADTRQKATNFCAVRSDFRLEAQHPRPTSSLYTSSFLEYRLLLHLHEHGLDELGSCGSGCQNPNFRRTLTFL